MKPRTSRRMPQRLPCRLATPTWLARLPGVSRRFRAAPILALILALAALTISTGQEPGATSQPAATSARTSRTLASAVIPAAHLLIGSADLHIENMPEGADAEADGDTELEINLAISQTTNDCQTPLYGEFCLRYNVLLDDVPVQAGYGLIPVSAITVAGSSVTLRVDTSHEPRLIRTAGAGGLIALTWTLPSGLPRPALHVSGAASATVRGSMVGYPIPASGVTAGILVYGAA